MRRSNETQGGFWGTVARKAKAILDDDYPPEQAEVPQAARQHANNGTLRQQDGTQFREAENHRKSDKAVLRKGFGAITSSLNYIGNALEEGLNIVENRTADIIQETRSQRLNVRKKAAPDLIKQPVNSGYVMEPSANQMPSLVPTEKDIQLQASRDVAMAMAAKTKLLLRELKTVKADLAFAKERCAQLEEENRILRESMEDGNSVADDELVASELFIQLMCMNQVSYIGICIPGTTSIGNPFGREGSIGSGECLLCSRESLLTRGCGIPSAQDAGCGLPKREERRNN